jgi:excisionase family DNA binding protein
MENEKTLTTAEFSQATGITVSTITRMLRQGRIRGEKRNGKWAIGESELQNPTIIPRKKHGETSADLGPIFDIPATPGKAYDVETFATMTYLTEQGVRRWLKTGRLSGSIGAGGKALVEATNLGRPEFKHLVRN